MVMMMIMDDDDDDGDDDNNNNNSDNDDDRPAQREWVRMGLIGPMQGAIPTQYHNP